MSIDGIQGTVLRDLFALIGRNIAGDPQMPPATLPGPAADPFLSQTVPRSANDAGLASRPLVADTSLMPSVSLAGLRDPVGMNDTLAARIAMRADLARLMSLLSASLPSRGERVSERESGVPGDPAEHPASGQSQPSASPRAPSLGSLPVTGAAAMDSTDNPLHSETSDNALTSLADNGLQPAAVLGTDASVSTVSLPDADSAGTMQAVATGDPSSLGMERSTASALQASMRENDSAVPPEEMAADAAQSSARTDISADTLDARLAIFSLASALERLLPGDSAFMNESAAEVLATFTQPLQAERAGVVASFLLNAAMIPGWPPPRPIEGVPVAVSRFVLEQKELSDADRDLLLHLGKLLNSPEALRRLMRKAIGPKRSKLMAALDFILTVMDDVTALLMAELERIEDLIKDDREKKRNRLVLR
ncbi:MAG: hypothetical protein ACOH2J_16630 [Allorhizobium sp.]